MITSSPRMTSIPFVNRNKTFSLKRIGKGCIPIICACTSGIIQSSIWADVHVFHMSAHVFFFKFQYMCPIFCPTCLWLSTLPARKGKLSHDQTVLLRAYCVIISPSGLLLFFLPMRNDEYIVWVLDECNSALQGLDYLK